MIVSQETALGVFKKVDYIREEYRAKVLNGDSLVLSIEDLQWVIEGMYNVKIIKTQVTFDGDFIRGMFERYDDRYIIRVRQGQPMDYMRFTAVKEMCHGIIDEKEDWSPNGAETLEAYLAELRLGKDGSEKVEAVRVAQSEIFAELAAIELMYPYECRESDLKKIETGESTLVKIANYHRMPAAMASRALREDHHEFVKKMRGLLDAKAAA